MLAKLHVLCGAVTSILFTQSARAVIGFDVPSGDYHVAANWAEMVVGDSTSNYSGPNIAPSPSQDVRIANGGVATVRAGHTADEGGANQFEIAYAANTSGALVIDPGARFAPRFDIRVAGNNSGDASPSMRTGTLTNNGGTVTASNLAIGFGRSSAGTFTMSGGTLTLDNLSPTATFLFVGTRTRSDTNAASFATLSQTGGDIVVTDDAAERIDLAVVRLGNTGLGAGRNAGPTLYDMSGGTLNTPNLQFGSHDTGAGNNTFKLRGTAELTTRRVTVNNLTATNTIELNGGTIKAAVSNPAFMSGLTAAKVMAGGARFDTGGFDIGIAQPLTADPALSVPDGGLAKSGSGSLALTAPNTYTGGTTVGGGTLIAAHPDAINTARPLAVDAGATLRSRAGQLTALDVGTLAVSATGRIDINDGGVVKRNGGSGPASQLATQQLTALVKAGLENGGVYDWQGPGISSTEAFNDNVLAGSVLYGVGIIQNNQASALVVGGDGTTTDETPGNEIFTTFKGRAVQLNDTLVRYTYMGDSDMDGAITGTDYTLIDNGFAFGLSGWINGDYDYSGVIDGTDYTLIDNAFAFQVGVLSDEFQAVYARHAAQFGQSYVDGLAALQAGVVPEPTTLGLLALAFGGLFVRMNRRKMIR